MSYRCDKCGATTPRKQSLIKRATYRKKTYKNRTRNENKRTTRGHEIEKEIKLCTKCDKELLDAESIS